jgi:diguanylate cyclase (GGDEF)-like protein
LAGAGEVIREHRRLRSAAHWLERAAFALLALLAVALPATYLLARLQYEKGTLTTTVQTRAYLLTQYIARSPQFWRFEEHRLLNFVGDSMLDGEPGERRRVLDLNGAVCAQNTGTAPAWPLIERRQTLYDAGKPVGSVVVERSVRQPVVLGAWIAFASLTGAALLFLLIKVVPLRILRSSEAELRFRAEHDVLTRLRNRESFRDQVATAVARARSRGGSLVVLFIDLDHFKRVNDAFGHDAGDAVLREIARRLKGLSRPEAVVARLSGDEFAILLPLPQQDEAAGLAAATAESVVQHCGQPIAVDGQLHRIGASVGTAVYPRDGTTVDDLLAHADTAMLVAKRAGRGQFRAYDATMQEARRSRMEIEADLRLAVAERQFSLHLQPLVDLATRELQGAEALLRWEHPLRGMVPPMEFIPLLEDMGLIQEVGRWVMHTACERAARWPLRQGRRLTISVNVSPLQFAEGDALVDAVRTILLDTGLPPACLQLELTEGLLMTQTAQSLALMQRLRALGLSLAIDDFGTGYSSLSYLRSFPVDTLKIDRSFVRDLGPRAQQATLVNAIIGLGHNLGMNVTAEGIETEDQRRQLLELGCDTGQGYLLGRPMPVEAFEALLDPPQPRALGERAEGSSTPALLTTLTG